MELPHLRPAERKAAQYILASPEEVVYSSVTEVAARAKCSEATVIRLCQALGFDGFHQLKLALSRELVGPERYVHQDIREDDPLEVAIQKAYAANRRALDDTLASLDMDGLRRVIQAIRHARRIHLYGAGTSALACLDAHYKFMRIGIDSAVYTDVHLRASAPLFLGSSDVVIVFSHSGSTADVVVAAAMAKRQQALVVVVSNRRQSPLARHADILLLTAADETPFGSGGVPTIIAQLSIVDALFVGLALADYDLSVQWLEKTAASVQRTKI